DDTQSRDAMSTTAAALLTIGAAALGAPAVRTPLATRRFAARAPSILQFKLPGAPGAPVKGPRPGVPVPGFPSRRSTCSKVGAWKSPSAHEWAGTLRNTPKNGPNCDRDHFHYKTPCWGKSLAGQTQRLDG